MWVSEMLNEEKEVHLQIHKLRTNEKGFSQSWGLRTPADQTHLGTSGRKKNNSSSTAITHSYRGTLIRRPNLEISWRELPDNISLNMALKIVTS